MDKEAVGKERVAIVTEEMMVAGAQSLIDGQANRPGSSWAEEAKLCYLAMHALAQQPAAQAAGLTTEQIEEVWRGVEWKDLSPVHEGFEKALRLRFARALLSRAAPSGGQNA